MMDDTPSNYNIANGRLEGKSMGLKAILMFAKNQGVQLGTNVKQSGLPQIQEELTNQSNFGGGASGELITMKHPGGYNL